MTLPFAAAVDFELEVDSGASPAGLVAAAVRVGEEDALRRVEARLKRHGVEHREDLAANDRLVRVVRLLDTVVLSTP